MSEYNALVFDLGKVIFDVSFGFAFDKWASVSGLEQKAISKKFKFDEYYEQFERDEIETDVYVRHVSELIGFSLSREEFVEGWNNIYMDAYPGIGKTLAALKKNYRLLSLTNTNRVHAEIWPVRYADTLAHFEKIFSSHEMKLRKPEKEAYQVVLDYLGTEPSKIIFLDDRPENIKAAEAVGIKSILVRSSSQMLDELKKEGITF